MSNLQLTAEFIVRALSEDRGLRRVSASCASPSEGEAFMVTAARAQVYGAPFAALPATSVQGALREGGAIELGPDTYRVLGSFRDGFARLVERAAKDIEASAEALALTVERRGDAVWIFGLEPGEIAAEALRRLPADTVVVEVTEKARDDRELGRKVGGARKDRAAVGKGGLTLGRLRRLEAAGDQRALAAIRKDDYLPPATLGELRARGVAPAVACIYTELRRSLPSRPPASPAGRAAVVAGVPRILGAVLEARSLVEARRCLVDSIPGELLREHGPALGSRFWNLTPLATDPNPGPWERARQVEEEADPERAWELARRVLRPEGARRRPAPKAEDVAAATGSGPKPLPVRRRRPLDQVRRVGPPLLATGPEDLLGRHGLTGLEFGNWVALDEGRLHVPHIAGALQDLEDVLGVDLRRIARVGNLAIAVGARGKGNACAHYEPEKRVINLTRFSSDGSLAHELGHFLDHMMGLRFGGAPRRGDELVVREPFLSERRGTARGDAPPPVRAMARLMRAIETGEMEEDVRSGPSDAWFDRGWVLRWVAEAGGDPQAALDRMRELHAPIFQLGRKAREKSVCLVHSLARWLGRPLVLRIRYEAGTRFVAEATALGRYWRGRTELFARAFEAFVEDELVLRSRRNEYLVDGTRRDYAGCRGAPYPTGDERTQIGRAIRAFLDAVRFSA